LRAQKESYGLSSIASPLQARKKSAARGGALLLEWSLANLHIFCGTNLS